MTLHPDVERLRAMREIESEPDPAPVLLSDMNDAELMAVALHDPDLHERRSAIRMLLLNLRLECEQRVVQALRECKR